VKLCEFLLVLVPIDEMSARSLLISPASVCIVPIRKSENPYQSQITTAALFHFHEACSVCCRTLNKKHLFSELAQSVFRNANDVSPCPAEQNQGEQ
jgi:hypothetical protein